MHACTSHNVFYSQIAVKTCDTKNPETSYKYGTGTQIDGGYFYWYQYQEAVGYDVEACKEKCINDTDCVAIVWDFDDLSCTLFSDYGETDQNSYADLYTCEETGGMLIKP